MERTQYGCFIMLDAWTDRKARTLINFLVNTPGGTMFIRSVDGSSFMKTELEIFELLDTFVQEIGVENVVQVVTDNGSNYVSPDIGKLPIVKRDIGRGQFLVGFIYNHTITLNLMRKFTQKAESDVIFSLKAIGSLVHVLRLVDNEKKPAMGYIYEAMDRGRSLLQQRSMEMKVKYSEIYSIIDNRLECQLHRPLHAAGHFLNPHHFYSDPNVGKDLEVIYGRYACIMKLSKDLDDNDEAHGMFGIPSAIRMRSIVSPTEWWTMYGNHVPHLQVVAIKILSLTCSFSGCERNWSTFEQIHSKKRNKLEHPRLYDLVFVKYNQALRDRFDKKDLTDPILLNNIDGCCDWLEKKLDENDVFADDLVLGEDGLTWELVGEAAGVNESSRLTRHQSRLTATMDTGDEEVEEEEFESSDEQDNVDVVEITSEDEEENFA
ncbi:uncharacterized protein [Cicer arietinum]|uniref:Uncharacterized protein LOC101497564 n=1 Tax=Cicer arietinum TaxID=3827 RepID=A0A1S3ECY1_CICAR|nr:uncharacterized protein LOC101497564 [Cicer arietinum]